MHDAQNHLPEILYHFFARDVGDVRHMLVQASEVAQKKGDRQLHAVLTAQAEAVMEGLHLCDLEELPDFMGDIVRFHQHFGHEYAGKPRLLPDDLFEFRHGFMAEELAEYRAEQYVTDEAAQFAREDAPEEVTQVLALQLDALVDLTYVVLGTAYLQFGAKPFVEAWKRVQAANMAKVRCERDEDSTRPDGAKFDIIKPAGWVAPDHTDLVQDFEGKVFRQAGELNDGKTINDGLAPR